MNEIGQRTAVTTGGSAFTGSPADWSWHYDALGQLEKAAMGTTGEKVRNYQYDHLSRLVSRSVGIPPTSTTRYLHDGWNPIAEYAGQELGKTHLWGMDLSGTMQGAGGVGGLLAVRIHGTGTSAGLYHPTYDGNGNISEYLTPGGSVATHYEYDPFGNDITPSNRAGTNQNAFAHRFSPKPIDPDTGLYYYGYRFYDPLAGRWPSRDPIEEMGGVNIYGFVDSSPVNFVDCVGLVLHPPSKKLVPPGTKYPLEVPLKKFLQDQFPDEQERADLTENDVRNVARGCIGICSAYQNDGRITGLPELAKDTKCFKSDKKAREYKCPEGVPFIFIKQGIWRNDDPTENKDDGTVPNDSVKGAGNGTDYNYVSVVGDLHIWASGNAMQGKEPTVYISNNKPALNNVRRNEIWCVTCCKNG